MRWALLALCLLACNNERLARRNLLITATDDGNVVVLWSDEHRGEWVSLVRADSQVEWTKKVEGHTRPSSYYDRPILGRHFVLRTYVAEQGAQTSRQRVQVQTFDLAKGTGWIAPLGSTAHEFDPPGHLAYLVGGLIHQFFSDDDGQTWLVRVDAGTGAEAGRTKIPFEPTDYLVRANDVVLRRGPRAVYVSEERVVESEARMGTCAARDRFWSLEQQPTGELSLVSEDGVALPLRQKVEHAYVEQCATFNDSYVLAVAVTDGATKRTTDEAWIVGADGDVTRLSVRLRGQQQLDGRALPRFLIVSIAGEDDEELAAIDLKERTFAWRSKFRSVDSPVLAGGHWYVAYWSSMILNIDGETGRLLAARRVPANFEQSSLLRNRNIGNDGIWLSSNDWYRSTPLVTKLDRTTLEHVGGTRITTVDVRKNQLFQRIAPDETTRNQVQE
jgi:hypothetical protein